MNPLQSWLHAWSLFFQGYDMRESCLWGIEVLWWGRIGKLLSFFSGLVIVLDIIGPDALNRATERSREGLSSVRNGVAAIFAVVATSVIVGAAVWAVVQHPYNPPTDGVLADNPDNASTNPWLLLVLLVGGSAAASLWAVWRGVFWVLHHDRVPRVARIASMLLFVVGFHFDMLAS